MERLVLVRHESGDQGTFGTLDVRGIRFFTGELPWRDNRSSVSCIPPGLYRCAWTMSARFRRNMYLVGPVPARAGIRKHSANLMGDVALGFRAQLNGCIALGEKLGWIDGQKAVLLSAPAVRRFEAMMGGKAFDLEVCDASA
jgi:hypothetical protein